MSCTAEYILLDQNDILEEIKVDVGEKKFTQYKQKWLNYVSRTSDTQNNSLSINMLEEKEDGRPLQRYKRPKQAICSHNFVIRRTRRRGKYTS
jgi:hypothetical protein